MLLVKATRPVNLLSESFKGSNNQPIAGIIMVPAETPMQVPNDVQDEPGFSLLEDEGIIKILSEIPDEKEEEEETPEEEEEETPEEEEEEK